MAEGSLSISRLLRQYEDRPFIVFSGFNRFKPPLVTDNGVIKTRIEWYSIEVPNTDAEQKQKLNPFSVTAVVLAITLPFVRSPVVLMVGNLVLHHQLVVE